MLAKVVTYKSHSQLLGALPSDAVIYPEPISTSFNAAAFCQEINLQIILKFYETASPRRDMDLFICVKPLLLVLRLHGSLRSRVAAKARLCPELSQRLS